MGQWFQSESGLHQNWMRDYDPTTGRYLEADPLGLVDGASVYGYVKQNPMRFTDPTGQFIPAVMACLTNVVCATRVYVAVVLVYELLCADTMDDYIAAVVKAMISVGNPCKGPLKVICAAPFRGGKGGGPAPGVGDKASDVPIVVTLDGVALPPDPKYSIPDTYVENPYRSGSYGEIVGGKFVERLRIDPPTPTGRPGPEYPHYLLDGGPEHFSPRPGDNDPGFGP
jgi:RHS repeat-associated protein